MILMIAPLGKRLWVPGVQMHFSIPISYSSGKVNIEKTNRQQCNLERSPIVLHSSSNNLSLDFFCIPKNNVENILEMNYYETRRFLPNLQLAENFKEGENVSFFVSANRIKPDECFSDDINKTGFCSSNTDLIKQ